MSTPKRVLISGGAGFIGSTLSKRLVPEYEVWALDNLHPQVHVTGAWPAHLPAAVHRQDGDVTDIASWRSAIDQFKPDVIVHLAAETGTGQSLTESARHASVNVIGTANLLDALSESGHRPESILLASSRAVYGEGRWLTLSGDGYYPAARAEAQLLEQSWDPFGPDSAQGSPAPHQAESVEPRPTNVYAATKLAQENLLTAWCTSMSVPLNILRLQNVYGAGQALENSYTGVLTYFARRAIAGDPIEVYEGGGITRDFVHVDDVVAAMHAAIERPPLQGSRTLDIGSGEAGTLFDYASTLAEVAASPAPVLTNKFRLGDVRAAFADVSSARNEIGYEPQVEFRDGVKGLLSWAETGQL